MTFFLVRSSELSGWVVLEAQKVGIWQ